MGFLSDVFKIGMTAGINNRQILRLKQNILQIEMMLKAYKDKFEKEQDATKKEHIRKDIIKIEKNIKELKELLKKKINE